MTAHELALAKEAEDFERLARNAKIESYRRLWSDRANQARARLAALRADKEAAATRKG